MIFLILSIIAAIILVALVLRRLPYLRTHRPGMEITTPRPYIAQASVWQTYWFKLLDWWQSVKNRPAVRVNKPNLPQFPRRAASNYLEEEAKQDDIGPTAYPDGTFGDKSPIDAAGQSNSPANPFWDENANKADPLELPTKGLVTRRGEAQKIAHELINQADAAFRKKDYKEAEKYYLQAATKDSDNARIYNRLGVIYLRTKNYKDAVEAFRGSIKFDDRVASRHYNLALAYLGKKDYRSAEKAVHEAIRLEPTNEKYRQTLDALTQ